MTLKSAGSSPAAPFQPRTLLTRCILAAYAAAFLMLSPGMLSASAITINVSNMTGTITITGGAAFASQAVTYVNENTNDHGSGGNTDTSGNASFSPNGGVGLNDNFTIKVGNEVWSGVNGNTGPGVISDQEKNPVPKAQIGPQDFESSSVAGLLQDGLFYQTFTLLNTGTEAYSINSLQLYTGLNPSFFSGPEFDSAPAIATGSLYNNIGQAMIISAGGELDFSVNTVTPPGYSLLVATVEEGLPTGGFGPPQTLAIAGSTTPEPGTMALAGLALLAISGIRRLRKS